MRPVTQCDGRTIKSCLNWRCIESLTFHERAGVNPTADELPPGCKTFLHAPDEGGGYRLERHALQHQAVVDDVLQLDRGVVIQGSKSSFVQGVLEGARSRGQSP